VLADTLIGSEILRIAAEIRQKREAGERVADLTIGDFGPEQFPVPALLADETAAALQRGDTKYPPSSGTAPLRESVRRFYARELGLEYPVESVLITSGSRPGIYAAYRAVVDPGDRVVYPVPSWNNNHYCHLVGAVDVPVPARRENAFLPSAEEIAPALRDARLLVLNSPSNPTGTAFDAETLGAICDAVLAENRRRGPSERPLYLLYDQVYWMLTFAGTTHVDPVSLRPAMRDYTIYIDGISKGFAATGMRVGWIVGPRDLVACMSTILGHVGAWAPRAEQTATTKLLESPEVVADFRARLAHGLHARLAALYDGLTAMRADGLPVDAVEPMGAMYLSARFALNGKRAPNGTVLTTNDDVRRYLLEAAGFGAVPFQAFGSKEDTGWFRLSAGAITLDDVAAALPRVRAAMTATT
jgi:aspartate aminotransferase